MKRLAALTLLAAIPLAGCIPLTPALRTQLNEYAIGVAHDNHDTGLDHAEVWCYSENGPDDTYLVTAVDSSDLLRYGSCRGIIGRGYGATSCNFELQFCRIFPEGPPPTTTVTFVDYGPPQ